MSIMQLITMLCLLSGFEARSQVSQDTPSSLIPRYQSHPDWTDLFTHWPSNYAAYWRELGGYPQNTYWLTAASTLTLLPMDQDIVHSAQRFSQRNNLVRPGTQERRVYQFSLLGKPQGIFMPRSLMGFFWYFGDGSLWLLTSGAFAVSGALSDNYRSTHVALQILEAMAIAGPTVLGIKLMTGRESPAKAEALGGQWHGFPGFERYASNQGRYYSYPSGHTTAAVAATTVLVENFPEVTYLPALRYGMAGLLMFALMNVGSHWPSDYPLAVLLGYTAGKTVVEQDRRRQQQGKTDTTFGWRWLGLSPSHEPEGPAVQSAWTF